MWRNFFTVFLTYAVLLSSSMAYGQYPVPQYPQNYPQNPPYGPQYPQAGQPQNPNAGPDSTGDEQHGVARLSVIQGDVNVRRGDTGELVAAVTNVPVMVQDHLQTGPGSRAEVELDYGSLMRLAPNTDVGFADLAYHRYQLQLAAGTIIYRVLRASDAQAEIDTPSIALRPQGPGEYRIAVLNDGTTQSTVTQISVRSGQAEIFSQRGAERLGAGRTILVRGNPGDPEFQPAYEGSRDQLDDWSATRDRELMGTQAYHYVSPDINGAEDLDAYGSWVPSQYGQVWQPTATPADWSPYSDGQWSWQPYYGWTWVDAAPWGWAPYHYGRWFWNGDHQWCWWPGAVGPRYLWSPALVGFFGSGAALGWVALAPFERFHAWWGFGRGGYGFGGYGRGDYGIMRGTNVAGLYRNAAIRGGAMTAGYNGFGGFRQRFSPATRGQLNGASLFRGQVPVSPTRTSYQFSARSAIANPSLASAANRQFFSRQAAGAGWPRSGTTNVQGASRQGSFGRSNGFTVPARPSAESGWQRFGDPGRSNGRSNGVSQGFAGAQEPSGWHRFGEARPAPRVYSGGRGDNSMPNYSAPRYQAPPQRQDYSGSSGGSNGHWGYSAPRSSPPPAQHYSAPPAPHYSAPSSHGGGGGSHGGGEHSSSGGHRGR